MKHLVYLYGLLLLLAGGCTPSPVTGEKNITVSILPVKYFIDRVSAGDFDVTVLVPPGTGPETYEPTPIQMKEAVRSRAYFHTGLIDFEQALIESITENSEAIQVVNLSEGLSLIEGTCLHNHEHAGHAHTHGIDPHIWLSPARVKTMVYKIEKTLSTLMPDSAMKYRQNTIDFISSIDSLDLHNKSSFQMLAKNTILIYHPSLTYYAADYGLNQIAIEQEGKEPSVGQFKQLLKQAENQGIKTVFFQEELHAPTVKAFVQENGLMAVSFNPLAYDWLENMKIITKNITQSLE